MKSCMNNGEYCTFHNSIRDIVQKMEAEEWFISYQERHKTVTSVWYQDILTWGQEGEMELSINMDFFKLKPMYTKPCICIKFATFCQPSSAGGAGDTEKRPFFSK